MAESILSENVIIEIGKVVSTDDIQTQVQTGTTTTMVYNGCQDNQNYTEEAFNAPHKKVYYAGDKFDEPIPGGNLYYMGIGDSNQGCQSLVTVHDGVIYEPTNNKLVELKLINSNSSSVPAIQQNPFNSHNRVLFSSEWRVVNNQDADYNIQGRSLYMEDRNSDTTYVWDVVDKTVHDYGILLKGNGGDELYEIGQTCPPLDSGTDILDWYVSAYQHSGKWSSRDAFTWDNAKRTEIMSYEGKKGNQNYKTNECFENDGYLGLRSDYFDGDLDCYELEIHVSSITNAKIEIFEGTPMNHSISQTNPDDITTTGIHKFCLAALRKTQSWGLTNTGRIQPISNVISSSATSVNCFANGITILNAKPIDSNSTSRCRIEYIKITKKDPSFSVIEEPVYSNSTAYTVNRYNWEHLDVKESEQVPLSLTFSVGDLKDITKRTAGFSKTFNIPASEHNNEVLTPMLAVGAQRDFISWEKARIKCNGVIVFSGLMRVEQGNTAMGGFYKCHFIEDTIDWSLAIGDETLCELDIQAPSVNGQPIINYTNSRFNIKASWSYTPDTSDFFWGLVNYGDWHSQSVNQTNSYSYMHNNNDFHPVVFAKTIVDKIFHRKGYAIESKFFESETFKKLCHPYCSGEPYVNQDIIGESGSEAVHVERTTKTAAGGSFDSGGKCPVNSTCRWYPNIVPGSDPSNNWFGNSHGLGYRAPFTGRYKGFMDAKLFLSQNILATSGSKLILQLMVNGQLYNFPNGHSVTNGTDIIIDPNNNFPLFAQVDIWTIMDTGHQSGLTRYIDFELDLQQGDYVSYRIKCINYSNLWASYADASDMNFDIYPIPSSTAPDQRINFSKILPCDKQIDYLKGLTDTFNLQWTANEETKTVYCEPYNDFFGSGKQLDWTDKLDHTSWNDKFIIEELAKEVSFQYEEDTSDMATDQIYRYKERVGDSVYKSHVESNDEKFRKEKLELGTDYFHATAQFNASGKQPNPNQNSNGQYVWGDMTWTNPTNNVDNPLMPHMWHARGHINTQDRPDYQSVHNFKMRLLNYYGETNCASWSFKDGNGNVNNENTYPHLGWINWWYKGVQPDEYNLSWADEDDGYGNISPGLFTKYWRVAYEKMNGGSALRTCKINLNAVDIATFDYRDLIHLRIDNVSTYWTVNKIIDYKPNQNLLTKVELIEWKQAKDFATNPNLSARNSSLINARQQSLISQSNNEGLVLKNNSQNVSLSNGIAFGNGVIANKNQTVIGNFNQGNTTDILQIGAGKDSDDRSTALSVTQQGEVIIHGGGLAIQEEDGLIHELVYTDENGEIKKLYLNNN